MKILYVDDNEVNRILLEDMIGILFENISVDSYTSAKEVLDLDVLDYNLILSDIDMPEIDGYELYNLLRNDCNYTKPIIAFTALAVDGDKEKMLMHGFNDYISKPIDIDELKSIIEKYI